MRTRYPYDFWTDVIQYCAILTLWISVFGAGLGLFMYISSTPTAVVRTVLLVSTVASAVSVLFTIWWYNRKFVS